MSIYNNNLFQYICFNQFYTKVARGRCFFTRPSLACSKTIYCKINQQSLAGMFRFFNFLHRSNRT